MGRVSNERDAALAGGTVAWGCCLLFAAIAPPAAAEESCCREVPWGTLTVAVSDGRLLTTGVDPQHPSAFALDKVLGDEVTEAVLDARVQLRTPAPTYASPKNRVTLQVGSSGGVEVKVRETVVVSRADARSYEPVQLEAEVELAGPTPIQIKARRPQQGPWLLRVRLKRPDDGGEPLHCLCQANLRNNPSHYRAQSGEPDSDDPFADVNGAPLFDGKTLIGWNCSVAKFRVEDGAIVTSGETNERACHYLLTDEQYGDFELTLKVKMQGGNSGIYFRAHREPGSVDAHGYQFDVGGGLWGMLYDERGTRIIGMAQQSMPPGWDPSGWVDCRIRCVGPRIQYWVNGHQTLDYVEEDTRIPRTGSVGLQFHSWSAHAFRVSFKDIAIKELTK